MKYIKTLLITILLVCTFTITKVYAEDITINSTDTKYDKNTNKFTITGTSNFEEVMVSIFDSNNNLKVLKTVSTNNNSYTATINIVFTQDQTVTVKVGDIEKTDHKLLNVDVEKSEVQFINTLTDDGGNSLTILNELKHFNNGDYLDLNTIFDLDSQDQDTKDLISAYQNKLGSKKHIVGVMIIQVKNGNDDVDLEETNNGYKLFLKADESEMAAFTKPYIARITDPSTIGLEEGRLLEYSSKEGGVPVNINNAGIYLLYDDTSVEYKFSNETKNQTYNLKTDKELTFNINADKDKFLKLYIDEKEVDSKYYSVKSGSTIITLTKDFLSNLSVGTHTVYVDFTDGYASGSFKVINESKKNPLTLDDVAKYGAILLVSVAGLFICVKNFKHKKN